jgi:arylsulfatase A-like enzyme
LGLAENTLVVFTTDHGDQMGAHRLIEKGPFAYEETWRLPMIAAHPGVEAPGSACDEFVYLHDLFPTFQEVAGLEPHAGQDSASILQQILGRDVPTGRESVYGAFASQIFPMPLRFVRTRTSKLVFNRSEIGELYDLLEDPHELHNLIDAPAAQGIKADLMARMRAHMVRLEDPMLRFFDAMRAVY